MGKPLAKSLHTVSVLVNLARYVMSIDNVKPIDALRTAMAILGYKDAADPYELAKVALRQLTAGKE
jgi:hypothetical protein